jgi:hypothetical protein
MNVLVIPAPASWRQPNAPRTEYAPAEGVEVVVSVVQGLPEDPADWIKHEVARRAAGRAVTGPSIERMTLASGWPALVAEATMGDDKLLLVMYQFLELGAVAAMTARADRYDALRDAVREVLLAGRPSWGKPPVTLADLLDGAIREP